MKTDFEKLKKLCDENGFQLITESPDENDKFFVVKKKDEWEGVEFIHATDTGNIYKIVSNDYENFSYYLRHCNKDGELKFFTKNVFKPSTEQAYVEQLKKEAFERFGEIKAGDRFIEAGGETWAVRSKFKECGNQEWDYRKESDVLFHYAVLIYKQGKWAERVKERITVEFEEVTGSWDNYYLVCFDFTLNKKFDDLDKNGLLEKAGEYLKEQLEKYLNNEI